MPSQVKPHLEVVHTPTWEMKCPSCLATLSTLTEPCAECGLGFILPDTSGWVRPTTCPLCGGKLHRKSGGGFTVAMTKTDCLQRQWALETGQLADPSDIYDFGDTSTSDALANFNDWRRANPDRLAGTVDAERLIRQARRQFLSPPVIKPLGRSGRPRMRDDKKS